MIRLKPTRYLLDTHVLLWLLHETERVPPNVLAVLSKAHSELWVIMVSLWEICIKLSIGKLDLEPSWFDELSEQMVANGVNWMPVESTHCLRTAQLEMHHRDPFDRMLIAQAVCDDLIIVTADRVFHRYEVTTLWHNTTR